MTDIKLKAKSGNEKIIFSYIQEFASDELKARINAGKKTLTQCWNYITSEAKKLAENGCACIEDKTVFGWAIHFFEEDDLDEKKYDKPCTVNTATSANGKPTEPHIEKETEKPKKVKVERINADQLSFEAMFGDDGSYEN